MPNKQKEKLMSSIMTVGLLTLVIITLFLMVLLAIMRPEAGVFG
jgi:hypothetical protein